MAVSQGFPTLDDLKAWLGLEPADEVDDVVLEEALQAATAAQADVVLYPLDTSDPPEAVCPNACRQAIMLRAQRYAARRNSPEGVVGLSGIGGELVGARLSTTDPDIARLEGPWQKVIVA